MKELNIANVINFFYEISYIPRESGKEEKIADYIENFARNRKLKFTRDLKNNIIIFKDSNKNNVSKETIILQCHVDMVCEKQTYSNHNFDKDSLKLYIENDYIKAKDTTLGADNGIGMAIILAILDDTENINNPNIEAIFTVKEETTMEGAKLIDLSLIKGTKMISTDNMSEEKLWLGSASAKIIEFSMEKEEIEQIDEKYMLLRIELKGLMGGHSGIDINKNRGNSIKIMSEILDKIEKKFDIYIKRISGGTKVNVIPVYSTCELYINIKDLEKFNEYIKLIHTELKELYLEDKNIIINFVEIKSVDNKCLNKKCSKNIIEFINKMPNGVYHSDKYGNALVSLNLGNVIESNEYIIVKFSIRSNRKLITKKLLEKINILKNKYNLIEKSDELKGYEYIHKSKFVDLCKKLYVDNFNKKPILIDMHVCLEVGYFAQKIPNLDFIAISPNIYNAHSVKEKCSIKSVERVYKYILNIIEEV